jgi:hypothetical protein
MGTLSTRAMPTSTLRIQGFQVAGVPSPRGTGDLATTAVLLEYLRFASKIGRSLDGLWSLWRKVRSAEGIAHLSSGANVLLP